EAVCSWFPTERAGRDERPVAGPVQRPAGRSRGWFARGANRPRIYAGLGGAAAAAGGAAEPVDAGQGPGGGRPDGRARPGLLRAAPGEGPEMAGLTPGAELAHRLLRCQRATARPGAGDGVPGGCPAGPVSQIPGAGAGARGADDDALPACGTPVPDGMLARR